MLYGIKFVASYLLGTDVAGRNLMVYPDDTFITSYPRSGNTWARFLIANLLHPDRPVTFANIESLIPDATVVSSKTIKRVPRPRLIKSHEYFDPRYPRVIYLVRDPRDVALSLYHARRKYRSIEDSYPLERFVSEHFLPGDLDLSWSEHVSSWLATRLHHPAFLLVRYEDLLQDAARELRRIALFLGVTAHDETLAQAVERSTAQRLRDLEKVEHERWLGVRGTRADVPFIGEATAGRWKQTLPESSVALIESSWGRLMNTLGYETSTAPVANTRVITG